MSKSMNMFSSVFHPQHKRHCFLKLAALLVVPLPCLHQFQAWRRHIPYNAPVEEGHLSQVVMVALLLPASTPFQLKRGRAQAWQSW
jgi:hypothetical protein